MVSKERFFCFLAAKRCGQKEGRRGAIELWRVSVLANWVCGPMMVPSYVRRGCPRWAGQRKYLERPSLERKIGSCGCFGSVDLQ